MTDSRSLEDKLSGPRRWALTDRAEGIKAVLVRSLSCCFWKELAGCDMWLGTDPRSQLCPRLQSVKLSNARCARYGRRRSWHS